MNRLRITFIQTSLVWEAPGQNIALFEKLISSITNETDILVLPEMFSSGFTMNAKAVAEPENGTTVQWMKRIAAHKNCVVTGSLVIEEDKKYYNRLIWMQPDGKSMHYNKRHLFRLTEEEKTYTVGKQRLIVEWKGWKICPLICYDLRFPVWSRLRTGFDYDLLLYVANWPERRVQAWKTLLPARAVENQCYVVGVNRVGEDGNKIHHSGDSAVYDFKGIRLSKENTDKEIIETITLELDELKEFRNKFPFWKDADEFELGVV